MHIDCVRTGGDIGSCFKYKPWVKMRKSVYISVAARQKHPLEVQTIELCASTATGSNVTILRESRKQAVIASARNQPKHAARYVWIISKSEREEYTDLKNVVSMERFLKEIIQTLDVLSTLSGMGGS